MSNKMNKQEQTPTFAPSTLAANQPPESINTVASSTGGQGLGWTPDLTPEQVQQFMDLSGKYTYSFPAGGYLSAADAQNANSYYNKFGAGGGGDTRANQEMGRFWAGVGERPTRPVESPALSRLYESGAAERPEATGPSYNMRLADILAGPYGSYAKEAGFGSLYQGPYQFGKRRPDYNPYGQYHPDNQYA